MKGRNYVTGHFITLEGGEGAGKTTIIDILRDKLTLLGYDVVTTREPGGIEIAEKIREVILDPVNTAMDARTEALLYAAARRQHLVEKVEPALEDDKIVLCDRFIDSSLAYQGHARGLSMDEVLTINEFAIQQRMPSLTLFLNIEPKKGIERIDANKDREKNRLDLEEMKFHERVFEGYQLLLETYPDRIKSINADQSVKKVASAALEKILVFLQDE